MLSNSSFLHAGTFTDHIICFQIFFATNCTLSLITKKETQISLQHILTKFWQPFQPRSNFTGSN